MGSSVLSTHQFFLLQLLNVGEYVFVVDVREVCPYAPGTSFVVFVKAAERRSYRHLHFVRSGTATSDVGVEWLRGEQYIYCATCACACVRSRKLLLWHRTFLPIRFLERTFSSWERFILHSKLRITPFPSGFTLYTPAQRAFLSPVVRTYVCMYVCMYVCRFRVFVD